MKRTFNRVVAIAATTLVAVAAAVAGAGAASATACPSSYTCTWDGYNYQGNGNTAEYFGFKRYVPDYRSFTYAISGTNTNDSASSISNNGVTSTMYAFIHLNCTGYSFGLPKNTGDGNLSDDVGNVTGASLYGFNNGLTSASFDSYLGSCY
ncbi:peptidase inhibitor family I36 protein [Cellulomonas sp. NPDC055163]